MREGHAEHDSGGPHCEVCGCDLSDPKKAGDPDVNGDWVCHDPICRHSHSVEMECNGNPLVTDGGQPTESADRDHRDLTFREVAGPLAEKSAEAARDMAETRALLRDDPDFVDAQWWLSEERGEVRALADAIAKLRTRFTDGGVVDVQGFAEWCWRAHCYSNEWRSKATGRSERAARGQHHGFHVVLDVLQSVSGIEYEDFADTEGVPA